MKIKKTRGERISVQCKYGKEDLIVEFRGIPVSSSKKRQTSKEKPMINKSTIYWRKKLYQSVKIYIM